MTLRERIQSFSDRCTYIGISPDSTHPDKTNIILGNQTVFALCATLSVFAVVLWWLGIERAPLLLTGMVSTFVALTWFIHKGYYTTGRVLGITVQNINVFVLSVLLGYETRVIDFLIISALMPLVLFSMTQKRWIAFLITQNVLLYVLYHLLKPSLVQYGIPAAQQELLYTLCIPVKFINILMVAFIIIYKRTQEEKSLKEAIADLQRVNDGLRQFAYATSHDLKTPLRNISTYLQLLKRKNVLNEESNQMVDSAVNSVKHLNQLISEIFLYTTTDFKNEKDETTDLQVVMKQIKEDTKAIFSERHATLVLPDKLPVVRMNHTQAQHVFSNLISNAIKYNKSHTPVVIISYKRAMQYYEFSVKDNGIGIKPEYQQQIFEIFKRLHSSEEYEGTGIGLAICKKIIESYGGSIHVKSVPAEGSEFVFTVPI